MSRILSALNERQREAVLAVDGPLLVLAGAGSGKTKMLTSRISHLIEDLNVLPHRILAVTFTNKAANEMRERVERTLQWERSRSYAPILEIGTFHSVCIRILRRELAHTPFSKPFVVYDDSDQLSLIKNVFKRLDIDEKSVNPKSIQSGINRAKCDALEPHQIEVVPHNLFSRQLQRVYEQYQKDLFANNALDFGEIICMVYRLFRDHPELRKKYQERYQYIHVDEYQDTNRSQYLLLSMLASAAYGGHQNICVVGDEDQSIYKWRGADIRNILDFEADYPGAKVIKLEQNYRSTQMILAAANQVIRNNQSRKEKSLWTENEEGRQVIRSQLPDERAEAEMTVAELKRLAESENRAYGDFAIFYRTNAQSRQFEDVFRREKIPYQIVGGLRFYDRKEIKDILSYFKATLNPSDSISLKRIINVPGRGIGKTTLDKLEQCYLQSSSDQPVSYWDTVVRASLDPSLLGASPSKKLQPFVRLMNRLFEEQPKLLLTELYHLILDETGYVRELREEATEEALNRIENLEEFNTLLQEFEEDILEALPEQDRAKKRPELLSLFIEQSALSSEADQLSEAGNSVKLMTLHSSKGLEFPVVFMVGLEEGLFPSIRPWEETPDEDVEEERRLCYVGMTRAREALYMLNVIIRRIWGNVSYQEPSRFFSEIPDEMIEFRDYSLGRSATEFRTGSSRQFGYSSYSAPSAATHRVYPEKKIPADSYPSGNGRVLAFPSQVSENNWVGRQLIHPEYGKGTVVSSEGSGVDQKVVIQFIANEKRKFLLKYILQYFG